MSDTDTAPSEPTEYRVLARKYRPDSFETLIGQDAMVRTLSNAIESGRLAHAFVMTGVRGVGKTTTARIIARALNCQNSDGPTITPCGVCDACVGISESRHVDVLEMDAASRTGVNDIREIIESVRYAPVSARFKIYIIDEVHMLSTAAFNALLKTLEEPPEHVKFIFATTEIRKIPVTVLSRCQRFDLKRVDSDALVAHLDRITKAENAEADEGALRMIARAAEGSVRDSLSLLDQAIAHTAGAIGEEQVRAMLGLADRALVLDLFEMVMAGRVVDAVTLLRQQYDAGADPSVVIGDMLEVAHWLTRLKVAPDAGADAVVSEAERIQGAAMAEKLALPELTRAWQMLLKGLSEVRMAPSTIAAAEMVLIRLAHAATLPDPAALVKKLTDGAGTASGVASAGAGGAPGNGPKAQTAQPVQAAAGAQVLAMKPNLESSGDVPRHPMPISFDKLVALFEAERRGQLAFFLKSQMRLVDYKPGAVTLAPTRTPPPNFAFEVKAALKAWTGTDWVIALQAEGGGETLAEQESKRDAEMKASAMSEPIVKAFLAVFDGAELRHVRQRQRDAVDILGMDAPDDIGDSDDGENAAAGDFDFDFE